MLEFTPRQPRPRQQSDKETVVKIHDKNALATEQKELVGQGYEQVKIIASMLFNKMRTPGSTFQLSDFIGWGTDGLIGAAKTFDSSRGVKFSTYVRKYIGGGIYNGLTQHNSKNSMQSSHHLEFLQARNKAIRLATNKLNREPEEKEIASQMNLTSDEYHKQLGKYQTDVKLMSLSNFRDSRGEMNYILNKIYQEINPSNRVEENKEFTINLLREFLDELKPKKEKENESKSDKEERERDQRNLQILNMYFFEGLTCKEIGEKVGLSEPMTSQIKNQMIEKLRKSFEKYGYKVSHKNKVIVNWRQRII